MYRPKYLDDITMNIVIIGIILFLLGIGTINLVKYIKALGF